MAAVKLLYFARLRDKIGIAEEMLDLPENIDRLSSLLIWLTDRGENYALALDDSDTIRVAIDQEHVIGDAPLNGAREIALFPPMTGG
jgi:molybdopterin synthase sulfur carrier subunit